MGRGEERKSNAVGLHCFPRYNRGVLDEPRRRAEPSRYVALCSQGSQRGEFENGPVIRCVSILVLGTLPSRPYNTGGSPGEHTTPGEHPEMMGWHVTRASSVWRLNADDAGAGLRRPRLPSGNIASGYGISGAMLVSDRPDTCYQLPLYENPAFGVYGVI